VVINSSSLLKGTGYSDWNLHEGMGDPSISQSDQIEVRFRDGETAIGCVYDWDQNWHWATTDNGYRSDGAIVAWRNVFGK
jgi:hypothetical protein